MRLLYSLMWKGTPPAPARPPGLRSCSTQHAPRLALDSAFAHRAALRLAQGRGSKPRGAIAGFGRFKVREERRAHSQGEKGKRGSGKGSTLSTAVSLVSPGDLERTPYRHPCRTDAQRDLCLIWRQSADKRG
jgi:hypothetical protein